MTSTQASLCRIVLCTLFVGSIAVTAQQSTAIIHTEKYGPCLPSGIQEQAQTWVTGLPPDDVVADAIPEQKIGSRPCDYAASLPRITSAAQFTYLGSFNPPAIAGDANGYSYGLGSIALTNRGTLIGAGHTNYNKVGEFSIAALKDWIGSPNTLNRAVSLQAPTDVFEGKLGQVGYGPKVGGFLILPNDGLVITAYLYYDANNAQVVSHFSRSVNFSTPGVAGPAQITNGLGKAGFVSGYMTKIPAEWQSKFGGEYLTGNSNLSIISRTSNGPTATVFIPGQIPTGVGMGRTAIGYPLAHDTLKLERSTSMTGMVFIAGTRSVLYFGRNGTDQRGPPAKPKADGSYLTTSGCYGQGTKNAALHGIPVAGNPADLWCYDDVYAAKGYHGWPYVGTVWAADPTDMLAVLAGQKQPWEITPYASFPLPLPAGSTPGGDVKGPAYDPVNQLLYVPSTFGQGGQVVIHVFSLKLT